MIKGPVYNMVARPLYHVTKPVTLPLAVGAGNFATRNYRQKPLVNLSTASVKKSGNKILSKDTERMPYRKRSYKKRRPTKRRTVRRRVQRRKRISNLWPRSKVVKFRLVFETGQVGTNGAMTMNAIKANSLNDPCGSLNAQLPLGLDQWAAMYQKYIVLGSRIYVKPTLTSSTGAVVVGLHLHDNDTSLANHNYYKELPRTRTTMVTAQKDYARGIFLNYSAKKFWHINNIKDDSEQEGAFSTTPGDPTDIAYFHFFTADLDASQTSIVSSQIIVEYIVLLTNPVTPARSVL